MPSVVCPSCKKGTSLAESNYNDTFQCEHCGEILRVRIKSGRVANVRTHKVDLEIPEGLPEDLSKILNESVTCYESGSFAASVVMAGLFIEGALKKTNVSGKRLVDMIEKAKEEKIISDLGFHVATASRLLRNIGAHFSDELTKITESDARLTLDMARKLAVDILESGAFKN